MVHIYLIILLSNFAIVRCDVIGVATTFLDQPFIGNVIPMDIAIESRKPGKMHDSLASIEGELESEKGYGYPTHYGFHPYGHAPSSHHGHHFGGSYEYGSTGHFGAPSLPPFVQPQPHSGYSYGSHFGSSEYGHHGFAGHSFGGPTVPPGIFGQIGQGNVNHAFPVGYSGYGYNQPVFNYNTFPLNHHYTGHPYAYNSYNILNSNHHNHLHHRHHHH